MGSLSSDSVMALQVQRIPWNEASTFEHSCHQRNTTPAWLLLSAWTVVVSRYTEVDPVVCCVVNRSDQPVPTAQHPMTAKQEFAITLPATTPVKEILANPQQYSRPLKDGSHAHTAVVIDPSKGNVPILASQQNENDYMSYDFVLVMDNPRNPSRLYIVYRTSKEEQRDRARTAHHLASTMAQCICQMLTHPATSLNELNLFSPQDHIQVAEWNARPPRRPTHSSIMNIIWQHTRIHPDKIAVDAWDGTLTFVDLQRAVSHLAHTLRKIGVGAEVMVPVLFDKSVWAIVAELAILQAGGAFVPLDPAQPAQRLQGIIEQVHPLVALTCPQYTNRLEPWVSNVVTVTAKSAPSAPLDGTLTLPEPKANAMAYVLFTSGSTGKPKGCVVEQAALADVFTHAEPLGIGPDSRVMQFASYSFGVSLIEIYCTLAMGATLCLPSDADRLNDLTGFMNRKEITWAFLTPSTAVAIDHGRIGDRFQTLVLAGEAMGNYHRNAWADRVELVQAYGLTEWAGICCISPRVDGYSDLKVIGRSPAANLWLVDPADHNRLAPVGTVAELMIEGPSLAREYLGDATRTDIVFVQRPAWLSIFGRTDSTRLYKTGDLVQYQPDGGIRYIARKDTQVKIRGKRLELGEVEFHVRYIWSGIERVVAEGIRPADTVDTPMLAAFIFAPKYALQAEKDKYFAPPTYEFRADVQDIRRRLEAVLPDHMLPSVYIPLSHVPLTITGKIDRRALRESAGKLTRAQLDRFQSAQVELVLPRTAVEKTLHTVIASILNLDPSYFGIHDSFLRLGGDSISAMRMANKCKAKGVKITVPKILQEETVAKMAAAVDPSIRNGDTQPAVETPRQQQSSRLILTNAQLEELRQTHLAPLSVRTVDEIAECLPCTAIQEGILLSQARKQGLYLMRFVWEIRSHSTKVDLCRLQQAWQRLSEIHPMLRTILLEGQIAPSEAFANQVMLKSALPMPPVVQVRDVNDLDMVVMEKTALTSRPHMTLCQTTTGDVYGILYVNHALVDAMSMSVMQRDLAALYDGTGDIPRSNYGEYVTYLQTISKQSGLAFWKTYLAGLEPCLFPLINDTHSQKTELSNRLGRVNVELGDISRYHRFCEMTGITLASIFKLAWALVLRAFTGSSTVCFGYMTAGRDAPIEDVENLVGPFINLLVCRVDIEEQLSLLSMVQKVQTEFIQALPHQHTSMADIAHALHLLGEAMFNTSMTFPPQAADPMAEARSLSITEKHRDDPTEYDIVVEVGIQGKDIKAMLKYWTSCLSDEQAIDVASTFGMALSHIIDYSENIIGRTQLLSRNDELKVARWNQLAPRPVDNCVDELIVQKCHQQPNSTAIVSWDGELTYGELDQLSSALSRTLRAAGVGAEDFVPLCFAKCRWTPVAVLGVIKAGAAFVLLDPSHPIERLQEICQSLNPKLALCSPEYTTLATALASRTLVVAEKESAWRATPQTTNGVNGTFHPDHHNPSRALYAVFTSGSTGKPKGVVVEHHSFCAAALAGSKALSLTPTSRVFQFSAYAFDVSVSDNLMPLVVGATICIPSDFDRRNNLVRVMNDMQVTWVTTTPSVARMLSPDQVPTLKTLALGGEAMLPSDLELWASQLQLLNLYGPAECAVGVTVQSGIRVDSDPAAIGWVTDAASTWIVDPSDATKLVPVGAVGELVIEGPLVARGYLNHQTTPSLCPFLAPPAWLDRFRSSTNKIRLYRTGDLVRYFQDGSLRYVGRKDSQVKLRGQRIELGEVESRIKSLWPVPCEAIAEVVIPQGEGARPMLVAFVFVSTSQDAPHGSSDQNQILDLAVTDPEFGSHAVSVTCSLEQLLPNYMIPALFIPLSQVPLSKTGKTDRRLLRQLLTELPRDDLDRLGSLETGRQSLRTPTERVVQTLYAQVLGLPSHRVWGDSHFFRMGGDSIVAMKLVRLARAQNFRLAVADLFHHPQVSALAARIDEIDTGTSQENHEEAPSTAFEMVPVEELDVIRGAAMKQSNLAEDEIENIYPCTPLQEGMMALTARTTGKYTAQLVYQLSAEVDPIKLREAWQRTVDANPILRTRIISTDAHGLWQVVAAPAPIEWSSSGSLDQYMMEDLAKGMSLGEPLVRFASIESSSSGYVVLTIHHALYDGWSLPLLVQQVEDAYRRQSLSPKPFAPFIRYVTGQDPSSRASFWESEFKDLQAPIFPALPAGYAQTPHPVEVVQRKVRIGDRSQQDSSSEVTLSNIIRLAWALVVSQYTDSNDVVFGVTVTGRSAGLSSITDLTGPTIATHPFRVQLDLDSTIQEEMGKVQSTATRMIPHEQIGLQHLRQINADTSAACDFQSHLGIQLPSEEAGTGIIRLQNKVDDYTAFASYAWVLVCELPRRDGDEVKAMANFDPEVITADEARRILNQFAHVLRQLCASTHRPLKEIEVASPEDVQQLMQLNSSVPTACMETIHGMVLQHAQDPKRGDTPAVITSDRSLTFLELDALSTRIASELMQRGLKRGSMVPLCFEKSIWPVVAMIGVMRAGGAVVNIDPALPLERIRDMLQDVEPTLILASAEKSQFMQQCAPSKATVVTVPTLAEINELPQRLPDVDPHDAAFIIFTSGSTGKPKGIVMEHVNLATSIRDHAGAMNVNSTTRALHFAAYAFDASIYEIFTTLGVGGCVCIPSESDRLSRLAAFMRQHQVNWAVLTPSAVSVLQPTDVPSLETLVLGGEAVTHENVRTWGSKVTLINAYGPAEATICSAGLIPAQGWRTGTIGPILGACGWVTVAGDTSRLAPLGTVGELLLEGPVVTREYLNRPEQTRTGFIDPPAWLKSLRPEGPGRLYRSQDLVQVNKDGWIRFIGRKDTQVKLRGQRIELGEVERHLRSLWSDAHEVVAEVVQRVTSTTANVQGSSSSLLVAFIHPGEEAVSQDGQGDTDSFLAPPTSEFCARAAAVRAKLQSLLPPYMVPSMLFPLACVPLTRSDKINRRQMRQDAGTWPSSLLETYAAKSTGSSAKVIPQSDSEKKLQELWGRVLSVSSDEIGCADNFFHLGGESIAAMKLAGLAAQNRVILSVADIFAHPCLKDMATVIDRTAPSAGPSVGQGVCLEPFSLLPGGDSPATETIFAAAASQCQVSRDEIEDIYPCTPLQEGVMALTAKQPGAYTAILEYDAPVGMNVRRYEAAWAKVACAHPILRTRIIQTEAHGSFQVVLKEASLRCQSAIDPKGFGLGVSLLQLSIGETTDNCPQRLILCMHHAMYDGWSLPLLLSEVERAWNGHSIQSQPFSPFIAHQIQSRDAAVTFWKQELADVHEGAVIFPAVPSGSYTPNPDRTLSSMLTSKRNSADGAGFTVATRLRLAWGMTVMQYTNSTDVVFGITTSGRAGPVAGIERIIGPAIATTPARVQLTDGLSIAQALQSVQTRSVAAMHHEHLGLQHIRTLDESTAAASQFQTLMVIQPDQGGGVPKTLFLNENKPLQQGNVNTYPLLLTCQITPKGVEVEAMFDRYVLDEREMERMLRQMEHSFDQLHESSPSQPLGALDPVNPADLAQLLEWNQLPQTPSPPSFVHTLIEERSMKQPDALAVCAWDGRLSYRDLNWRASNLAAQLLSRGVGSETFVPLLFDKSCSTVIAQLAVMKAGGAFVLLDASSPIQRLRGICDDVKAPLVLASHSQDAVAKGVGRDVLIVTSDSSPQSLFRENVVQQSRVNLSNAAYAVFTSGSTGKPKGVVIEHASLSHSVLAHIPLLGLNPESRVLQFAGYAFDIAIMDHLSTLVAGGCICIPSESDRRMNLAPISREFQVNWACLTSSVIRTLCPSDIPTLKTLVQAGEPIAQDIVDNWAGCTTLMNGYGPAECTILSSIESSFDPSTDPRDIGLPCGGPGWILDPVDPTKLLPIGAVGELVIQGPLVGRGYLNNAEQTAAAFVSETPAWLRKMQKLQNHGDPTLVAQSSRLYRTGDLVRYGPDGRLQYLGRKDGQVKLRGQRIELLEIEHQLRLALTTHGQTPQVAVELISPDTRSPFLAAFINLIASDPSTSEAILLKPSEQFIGTIQNLERKLYESLPEYMIPSAYLPVSSIPLGKSGKADRQQLREVASSVISADQLSLYSPQADSARAMPTTELEIQLQTIWARVLNVSREQIGVHDSFLRIGGDSITAMQVATQCKAAKIHVRAAELFKFKNIAELAAYASALGEEVGNGTVSSAPTSPSTAEEFDNWTALSPIQQLFFDLTPDGHNHFNQSFFLRFQRPVDAAQVKQAVDHIITAHVMLRARFRRGPNGQWTQAVMPQNQGSCRFSEHTVGSREDITQIAADSQRSLDIQHGPLFVVDLVRDQSTGQQYLFMVAHHLVIDLVSWRVIFADLEEFLVGKTLPMHVPMPFLTWCREQEAYAAEHLAPSTAFPSVDLPMVQDNNTNTNDYWQLGDLKNTFKNVEDMDLALDKHTTDTILYAANDALHTQPVELIQAALLLAFVRTFTDRPSPIIFTEGHGREPWDPATDLSRTVGWFTSIWPAAVALLPSHDIVDAVRRTKDARRRVPANGWPYFASRYLNPAGRETFTRDQPMEILFNYLGRYQQLERPDALMTMEGSLGREAGDIADEVARFALIDISAYVSNGCLQFKFLVNRHMQHQDRIRQWLSQCEITLKEAATALISMQPRSTLADFPLVNGLSYERLDDLEADVLPYLGLSITDLKHVYPCSPVQRGILLAQARNQGLYQTRVSWKIDFANAKLRVDVKRLSDCWQQLVDRHDILRTVFFDITDDGFMEQLVLKKMPANVRVLGNNVEWTDNTDMALHLKPLHELTIHVNDETDTHVRVDLDISHGLIDGASLSTLKEELALAYAGRLQEIDSSPFQLYIEYLQCKLPQPTREYWQTYLNGAKSCHFPALRNCNNEGQDQQIRSYVMDLKLGQELNRFCDDHGISMTVICHLAWSLVLRSYTGQEHICFGYLTSGRDLPITGIQNAVGVFINMLVGFVSLDESQSVLSALSGNQRGFLNSLDHQHFSLADLQQSQNLSGASLFNTIISIQKETPSVGSALDSTVPRVTHVGGEDPTEYPLTVNVGVREEGVGVSLTYWTSFLSDDQATSVAQSFQQALSQILAHPSTPVSQLQIFSPRDQAQITRRTELPVAIDACIHELVEQRSRAQPSAQAICAWDGSMTYEELDRRSTMVALQLLKIDGLGPEQFVPLCFEKSIWTVVAILAVLKTGSAFVLLDASAPLPRLQRICQDVHATVVLAGAREVELAGILGPQVFIVSSETSSSHNQDFLSFPQDGKPRSTPQNAAYVIFTSGSTGTPKGVVIEHRAFCSSAHAQSIGLQITQKSRVLQFASYAFDACVLDILTTLIAGGCICVPSESDRRDRLASAMNELQVTWAVLTPSVARVLNPEELPHLRTLVLGGEAASPNDISTWSHLNPLVAYGPAECAVTCMLQAAPAKCRDSRNIGFGLGAIPWVVDPDHHDRLVPIGVVGELVIEGPIVGREYLGSPAQTTKVFIEAPAWRSDFPFTSQGRMYKTGDLVHYNPNGSLQFVGRKDTQVKLRGQRIELGEVEAQVSKCFPSLDNVIVEMVELKDSPSGDLVAFAMLTSDSKNREAMEGDRLILPPTETHREIVSQGNPLMTKAMPSYMIPIAILPISHVPLSKSGKVGRKQLREAAAALTREEIQQYKSSRTALTGAAAATTDRGAKFLEICAAVLDVPLDRIGMEDDFFSLGGNSLTAMKMTAMMAKQGYQLSVKSIFDYPRLTDLEQQLLCSDEIASDQIKPFSLLPPVLSRDQAIQLVCTTCEVPASAVEDVYPCTALQEGLMALTAKKMGAYVGQFQYELPVDIDFTCLHQAWDATSAANSILRTRLIFTNQQKCLQAVIRQSLQWQTFASFEEYQQDKTDYSFGLGTPLVRLSIIDQYNRTQTGKNQLLVEIHHAIYDGWSLPLLMEQVAAAYRKETLSNILFAPFIQHMLTLSTSTSRFWRKELSGTSSTTFPFLPSQSYEPQPSCSLSRRMSYKLTGPTEITLTTHLRLAWAILAAQYTASNEVVFGVTVNGRGVPVRDIEKMTGPTIATIPFRVPLDFNKSVADNLTQLQKRSLDMMPFEQIGLQNIARLGPEAAAACQFQTLLVVQPDRSTPNLSFDGLFTDCREISKQGTFTTYPLLLDCHPSVNGLDIYVHYDGGVLSDKKVDRILCQLEHILTYLRDHPDSQLTDISLAVEDWITLFQWNDTLPTAVDSCVHDLIQQQCMEHPDAPAVCAWDGDLTYTELDKLSSLLARSLIQHGVQPETFIPVYLDKSRWVPVSMLAILKTGAAYVLLDTTHPIQRLRGICEEVNALYILSTAGQRNTASQLAGTVIEIGGNSPVKSTEPSIPECGLPIRSVQPSSPAYMVFTSGSTGKPKGAIVSHRNLASSMAAHAPVMQIASTSRVLQFASHAFDATMAEIMTTLFVGGCVCIPSEVERKDDITGAASRMKVNWAFLTPTVARIIQPAQLPALRTMIIGGEGLHPSDVSQWQDHVQLLIQAYGPSECTIFCSAAWGAPLSANSRNLGRPMGSCAWVVDPEDHHKLAPVGAVGELLIEGPIVCQGYLNQPDKTAAAFIDPPAWLTTFRRNQSRSERVYKTGDLVQFAPDGSIVFIGRKDNQVKIRGQRIELGEIETQTLQAFRDARQVIVEVIPASEKNKNAFICAFVWQSSKVKSDDNALFLPPSDQFRADIADAESDLRDRMPVYMVPDAFLPLTSPPTTKNGKVDRRLLINEVSNMSRAAIDAYRTATLSVKRTPNTAAEHKVHQLVAGVLNIEPDQIGMDDNFFRIGGDSITAMVLVGAARQAGVKLSVPDIFKHPKLVDLALCVTDISTRVVKTVLHPGFWVNLEQQEYPKVVDEIASHYRLSAADFIDILPTSQFQRDYLLRKECNYFVLDIPGSVSMDRVRHAIDAVVAKYSILRTVFVPLRDTLVQIPLHQVKINIQHVYMSSKDVASHAERLARVDSLVPVPYGSPHFQVMLVSADDNTRHLLVLRLSHAQYDGFSLARLYMDLAAAYEGMALAPAPDFATYMVQRQTHNSAQVFDFWREYLEGSSITQLLPYNQPQGQSEYAIHLHQEMRVPSLPDGITMATLYKAAWALVLARQTQSCDLVFGQVVNGRSLSLDGIENILGACVHIIPVRVQIQGDWRIRDLLQHVQAEHTRTLPYETVDMDDLISKCTDWRQSSRLGTVAQHQNVPVNPGFKFAGVECTTFGYEFNYMPKDLYVISVPRGNGYLAIDLSVSSKRVDEDRASVLLGQLCEMIESLAGQPDEMVVRLIEDN